MFLFVSPPFPKTGPYILLEVNFKAFFLPTMLTRRGAKKLTTSSGPRGQRCGWHRPLFQASITTLADQLSRVRALAQIEREEGGNRGKSRWKASPHVEHDTVPKASIRFNFQALLTRAQLFSDFLTKWFAARW